MHALKVFRNATVAAGLLVATPALADVRACPAGPKGPDRQASLYGDRIDFDVYRLGKRVGHHRVRFERDGAHLVATSELDLRIDLMFLTVFRYAYRSVERWQNGSLAGLDVTVNDNGEPVSINAVRDANGLTVRNGRTTHVAAGPIFPTNHWNADVVLERRVLNTLTGQINAVGIELRGREPVETERGPVAAKRYSYTGDLSTDVWYDECGRWVKMRFVGRDGATIDYVCRRCQGPGPA